MDIIIESDVVWRAQVVGSCQGKWTWSRACGMINLPKVGATPTSGTTPSMAIGFGDGPDRWLIEEGSE